MAFLKPSTIVDNKPVIIVSAQEKIFTKFGTTIEENFVSLTFDSLDGDFKVTADNFIVLAKQLGWNYNNWVGKTIKLYTTKVLIGDRDVQVVKVGELLP